MLGDNKAEQTNGNVAALSESLTTCERVFKIDLPLGVGRDTLVLGSSSALTITDGVRLVGATGARPLAASTGTTPTDIGVEADIGTLVTRGSVTLRDRSRVAGDVVSSGQVVLQNQARVTGTITRGATLAPQSIVAWTVCFPSATGANVALEPDQQRTLSPGNYGDLSVKSRARLTLGPGSYTFRSIFIEPQAVLNIADPGSVTTIYSLGGLTFRGQLANVDPGNLLIGAFGAEAINIESAFQGTVVAPNGAIQLASLVSPARHTGSFFAKEILVRPHTTVVHVPFRGWVTAIGPDPDNDGVATAVDNCPNGANSNQLDGDGDELGDVCDLCPNGAPGTLVVGAAGGLVCTDGERLALSIPPGALAQNVTITVTPSSVLPAGSGLLAGRVYDFEPHGLTFASPVELTLAYRPDQVPAGIPESSLVILSSTHGAEPLTDQPWEERPSVVDTTAKQVTGSILHFSHDGIGAPVVRIQMSEAELTMALNSTRTVTAQSFDASDNVLNHLLTWSSDDDSVASVRGSSVSRQFVGIVSANGRGDTFVTATARNADVSGNALGATLIHVNNHERRITVEGTVHIHDDDSGDPDCLFHDCNENGDFGVAGFCDVDDTNLTSTVTLAGTDTCVDDEIYGDLVVTCSLGTDHESVAVTVNARVHEGSSCPDNNNNGSDVKVFPNMPDGTVVTDSWKANTGEGGFSSWSLSIRNDPR